MAGSGPRSAFAMQIHIQDYKEDHKNTVLQSYHIFFTFSRKYVQVEEEEDFKIYWKNQA